ncbi:MAG: hypothetical protein HGB17_19510 [Syntrophobacteraceae bacterium]|nr:hypothetical protein [Syntrophobacteraceae bacterium]
MASIHKSWLRKRMGWAAIGLSVLYWIVESILDSFVYGLGTLDSRLVSPDLNETIMRLLAIGLLISFGFYAQVTVDSMERTQARLSNMNECFVSFGPAPIKNIQHLTEFSGELLKSSASFYSQMEDGKLRIWSQYGKLLGGEGRASSSLSSKCVTTEKGCPWICRRVTPRARPAWDSRA